MLAELRLQLTSEKYLGLSCGSCGGHLALESSESFKLGTFRRKNILTIIHMYIHIQVTKSKKLRVWYISLLW